MYENGDLFQLFWNFSSTVIATKPNAQVHIRLAELHVLVYDLEVYDQKGPSFSGLFLLLLFWGHFSVLGGILGAHLTDGLQTSFCCMNRSCAQGAENPSIG